MYPQGLFVFMSIDVYQWWYAIYVIILTAMGDNLFVNIFLFGRMCRHFKTFGKSQLHLKIVWVNASSIYLFQYYTCEAIDLHKIKVINILGLVAHIFPFSSFCSLRHSADRLCVPEE